jgi:N12 class adenine-specific DNA methylase
MKASEIVDKLKSVLLSAEDTAEVRAEELSQEEVNEIEVNAAEEVSSEQEALEDEMPAEEEVKEIEYVSKDDFEKAMAEVKAMYEAIVAEMGSQEMEVEVPTEELSKEEEVDLSSQEPAVEPIAHTPEVEPSAPQMHNFASRRPRGTMDTVYAKMFNK